jgi:NADP-dependent 3-hydroxy acid dehydrogenase YdfG
VRAGNARIPTELPPGLVGVFAGATSGVGELALKGFAKHAARPKIYFIGRSQEAGARLLVELKELNDEGEYNFIKADVSLMKNVDQVCREIKEKEKVINVLLLSQGTLNMSGGTSAPRSELMSSANAG